MTDFKFGICTSFRDKEKLLQAKQAGAEYIEANFCDLSKADEEAINDFIANNILSNDSFVKKGSWETEKPNWSAIAMWWESSAEKKAFVKVAR